MYDLRKLHFPEDTPPGTPMVVFFLRGNECYFTAVGDQKSSMECADLIVESLVRQTTIPAGELRVFDLQTHMGYAGEKSGRFRFDELFVEPTDPPRVYGWRHVDCPDFVRKVFGALIGRP